MSFHSRRQIEIIIETLLAAKCSWRLGLNHILLNLLIIDHDLFTIGLAKGVKHFCFTGAGTNHDYLSES
uniref:Uncharacterized protein n=1 Tax=Romanomermis culicivorax TaxID=13658 RepID=A0A915HQI7_ROMCU